MGAAISIRAAKPEDAAQVARVQVESWRTAYRGIVPDEYLAGLDEAERTVRWRQHLEAAEHILVAESSGEIVGFIDGGPIREMIDGYDAELYAIYLLPKCQRIGIGSALLMDLVRHLVEDGFQSLAVWVFEANSAVRFYERWGAVRVGLKEREIGGARLTVAAYGWPDLKKLNVTA
jgi:ribosomal protein S18 acetylase RimI-like enzyme